MKRGQTELNFLLAVNKASGITSHDVVNKLREIFGEGRIGHMGTLDPLATGVLLIGVGSATRLNTYLDKLDKSYIVSAKFGKTTDTYDAEGEVLSTSEVPEKITEESFAKDYLASLVGEQLQTPPAYSAIKVDGKAAYKNARKGEEVEIEPRDIEIYSTELLDIKDNT